MQNKCIRFCLRLGKRTHVGVNEFEKLNWLPVEERFKQCICVNTFKFFNNSCPIYMTDIYKLTNQNQVTTRTSALKLSQPLRKTNYGQRCISFLGPSLWNNLSENLKTVK